MNRYLKTDLRYVELVLYRTHVFESNFCLIKLFQKLFPVQPLHTMHYYSTVVGNYTSKCIYY
jgi:hypothetical protein